MQPDAAIADFTEAIRINPNNARAYQSRGMAYEKKGETAKAKADIRKAEQLAKTPGCVTA